VRHDEDEDGDLRGRASVRAALIPPCRRYSLASASSRRVPPSCGIQARVCGASVGWRLVLAHGTMATQTAGWLGGEGGPSVPLTNEADDNRRKADEMDARTVFLLPRDKGEHVN
jgi:hypothetical protein